MPFPAFSAGHFHFFLDIRENLQVTLYNYALSAPETKISKSKLFSCLQKVYHVTNCCKRPIPRDKTFLLWEEHLTTTLG